MLSEIVALPGALDRPDVVGGLAVGNDDIAAAQTREKRNSLAATWGFLDSGVLAPIVAAVLAEPMGTLLGHYRPTSDVDFDFGIGAILALIAAGPVLSVLGLVRARRRSRALLIVAIILLVISVVLVIPALLLGWLLYYNLGG